MTRKRKIPQNEDNSYQKHPKTNEFSHRKRGNYHGSREQQGNQGEQKQYHDKRQKRDQRDQGEDEGKGEFPVALVRYLEQMAKEQPTGELLEIYTEKCLEEVEGQEEHLLHFVDGCMVVEAVFTKSATGSFEYLKRLQKQKKKQRIQLMYTRSAERVIEKMIYKMMPFKDEHEDVISSWVDLLIENWNDVIADQACSFLIRGIAKALCGIDSQLSTIKDVPEALKAVPDKKKLSNGWQKQELDKLFIRAFDYTSMNSMLILQPVSFILQDFAALERKAQTGQVQNFVAKFIEDEGSLLSSFSTPASSRLWEQLIANVDEQIQESLFVGFISDNFKQLATHPTANYPLKKFLASTKSEEIATEVSALFLEILPELIEQNKLWIVGPALKLLSNYADLQDDLIKALRSCFKAGRKDSRQKFLPHVLCLNDVEVEENDGTVSFDVTKAKVNGSLILTQLFHFKKNQTLLTSLNALSQDTLVSLISSPVGSHVFDGFFASKHIDTSVKIDMFEKLNPQMLIKDKYGSRVFENFWFQAELDVTYREKLVREQFVPMLTSKDKNTFVYILINKVGVRELREDPKRWRQNLKQKIEEGKQYLQFDPSSKPASNQNENPTNSFKKKK